MCAYVSHDTRMTTHMGFFLSNSLYFSDPYNNATSSERHSLDTRAECYKQCFHCCNIIHYVYNLFVYMILTHQMAIRFIYNVSN